MHPDTLINRLVPTLFEDEYLLAVVKPAGLDAGGRPDQTAPGLAEIFATIRGTNETLEPVNRLSRYESGVLLFGKEPGALAAMRSRLRSMEVAQEYVAVVLGKMREPRLKIGLGPEDSVCKEKQRGRAKGRSPQRAGTEKATLLSLVKAGERRTLVRCRTHARSTHVLRAQLRSAQLRLVGDALHDRSRRPVRPEETCLHLTRMRFDHPHTRSSINLTSGPPSAFDEIVEGRREIERALHAALTRRLTCITEADTDSYRLLTGDVEGIKGLVAEKYGPVVILQVQEAPPHSREGLRKIARWYRNTLGMQAVYASPGAPPFPRAGNGLARAEDPTTDTGSGPSVPHPQRGRGTQLIGAPPPEQIVITERGLKFAIRPHEGQSVGLFLGHRDNRTRVRSMAGGKNVLNLFAYTCGFSVAAGAGGANLTVNVDISPKSLKWGQANFELNGLDPAKHQFVQSEAFDYLGRAKRQAQQFDLIVLDPPSFAHGRKRGQSFSLARDMTELVTESLQVLRPGGVMMISTNFRRLSISGLRERVKHAAGARPYMVIATPPLPADFAMDPDHAKTMFVRFE